MRLQAESGNTFALVIVGYEYPDITEDWWDSNWLVISGNVSTAKNSWRFVHPCVTTFELANLADWLDKLGAEGETFSQYAFTEPNLEFTFLAKPSPVLRVRFAHESAPPWLKQHEERLNGMTLDFPLSHTKAHEAAADLRNALVDYPVRGGAA